MSTFLDLLFGNDAEKRKTALQIADDLAGVIGRRLLEEAQQGTVQVNGTIAGIPMAFTVKVEKS